MYWFNMILNSLVQNLSIVVSNHLFITKREKRSLMPRCHHSASVVLDKNSTAQLLRDPVGGLSRRTCGEATRTRGHLDYKYREFVDYLRVSVWEKLLFTNLKTLRKTLRDLASAWPRPFWLTVAKSHEAPCERDHPAHQHWHLYSLATVPQQRGLSCWQLEINHWIWILFFHLPLPGTVE